MVVKWYVVLCDLCGNPLRHYYNHKPTPTELRNDGIKLRINNGKVLTYCEECYNKIKGKEK